MCVPLYRFFHQQRPFDCLAESNKLIADGAGAVDAFIHPPAEGKVKFLFGLGGITGRRVSEVRRANPKL